MGFRSRLRNLFYRSIGVYDGPNELYASMKGRKAILSSLDKQQSWSEPRKVIRIWRRNLEPFKEIPTVGRLGHWCIQVSSILCSSSLRLLPFMEIVTDCCKVDQTYFELLVPDGSTKLGITECPAHPFEGYLYEAASTTSTTTFTAGQVHRIGSYAPNLNNHTLTG